LSIEPPSFRKGDRNALAPKGELGGIEGTRGADQYQERLIKTCEICSAILIEAKGFVVCKSCQAIVHASPPCSTMVDGQATCSVCLMRLFPYDREMLLVLTMKVLKPRRFNLAKKIGVGRQDFRHIEDRLAEEGLLNKGKPTRLGLRAYYYLYQVFAFEPDVAMLISEMETAMNV
jgi:hypothetical protein